MQRFTALLAVTLSLCFASAAALADEKTDKRLEDARLVFESFTGMSEQSVPDWMLERAYGIVVAPKVFEIAVGVGGRGGRGVMAVRNPDGTWSNPVFLSLYGGSFGIQFGMHMTDTVLVLMSRESVEGISGGKFTLGADASVAAGPVGRAASASTDPMLKSQVLSYSQTEGVFAGVALAGTAISVDDDANATAYGVSGILASQILNGTLGTPPAAALEFKAALARATDRATAAAHTGTTAPAAAPPATAPAAIPATPATEPKSGSPAQTYPMEDPQPGAPPPP
jgi:lipid-binding SYLF domain-containing protein